jgi:hypothetical protein
VNHFCVSAAAFNYDAFVARLSALGAKVERPELSGAPSFRESGRHARAGQHGHLIREASGGADDFQNRVSNERVDSEPSNPFVRYGPRRTPSSVRAPLSIFLME